MFEINIRSLTDVAYVTYKNFIVTIGLVFKLEMYIYCNLDNKFPVVFKFLVSMYKVAAYLPPPNYS